MTVLDRPRVGAPRHAASHAWLPLAGVALLATVPTLLGMVSGGVIADDWMVLDQERAAWTSWLHGIAVRFRPIQAAYHGITFAVVGAPPVAHLLLVAALQGLCAVLVVLVARRWF